LVLKAFNWFLTAFNWCFLLIGVLTILYLITAGAALDLNIVQPKPAKWITDESWLNLVELSNLHQFSGIVDQVRAISIRNYIHPILTIKYI